jgi:RNA polymerase sigma-70 factor (ECF subfamily)
MHKDMLYNASYRILKNSEDAQDTVHDAFIKAFKGISKVDDDLNLGAWLRRIVVNTSLDFLKKHKRMVKWDVSIDIPDDDDETEALEEVTLKVEEVKRAINGLSDSYRITVVLYLIENYTHREIAKELGLKESTVRNQYRRAKLQLKKQLKISE